MTIRNDAAKRQLLKFVALSTVVDLLPGCGGSSGSSSDSGSSLPVAPALTAQPGAASVTAGATATFSVTASGSPAPAYQWQSSTDGGVTYVDIGGATAASYTTPVTTTANSGTLYRVVVSNSAGSVTSTPAALTVAASGGGSVTGLSLLAGNAYGPNADGTGPAGTFSYPMGPSVDAAGNLYVADSIDDTIRKITPAGAVTTLSGMFLEEGNGDGTGTGAAFYSPRGTAVDASGVLYVADTGNNLIRKISPSNVVTTLAGTGLPGHADGAGTAASFFGPMALAVDGAGNLFVADAGNAAIRKIAPDGTVSTFAGTPGQAGSADGSGTAAQFNDPEGITIGADGTLYVADYANHLIRKITPAGVVTTLAGSAGVQGGADGAAASATFDYPNAVAIDAAGNLYVGDGLTSRIRRISAAGVVSTLIDSTAGTAPAGFSVSGLAVDNASGLLYVTNGSGNTVLSITAAGAVGTLAGSAGSNGGRLNGTGAAAQFMYPAGLCIEPAGNVIVADTVNDRLRRVTPAGVTTTVAGAPPNGSFILSLPAVIAKLGAFPLPGYSSGTGSNDGTGTAAAFSYPLGVVSDSSGTLYVADANNAVVRQVSAGGVVTTLAGLAGHLDSVDGTGSAARFSAPTGIAIDGGGNLYVTDYNLHVVRKIAPGGVVTTLAGTPGSSGSTDGSGAAARFAFPTGIAVDGGGNVYVADTGNSTIRLITPAGAVSTIAGSAGMAGSANGSGSAARFDAPSGLALDGAGNLYVSDTHNHTVRRITGSSVSTVVGVAGQGQFRPGALPGGLREPAGLAISGSVLYIATMNGVAQAGLALLA